MSKKHKEAKFKTTMELAKAVTYLEDVVSSLRAGTISISNGADALTLTPESTVKIELEAQQKEARESISLRVSWRKEEDAAESQHKLRISTREPAHAKTARQPER